MKAELQARFYEVKGLAVEMIDLWYDQSLNLDITKIELIIPLLDEMKAEIAKLESALFVYGNENTRLRIELEKLKINE